MNKSKVFLLYHPGHSGGSWFHACCRTHPLRITVLGEAYRPTQLDFEYTTIDEHDEHTIDYLESRMWCGDACVGIIKSFGRRAVRWAATHDGVLAQIYRNPIKILARNQPLEHKMNWIVRNIGQPESPRAVFEGHVLYYANMFKGFVARAEQGIRLIRLEKMTESIRTDGTYFVEVMQHVTQLGGWSQKQVAVVRRYLLPGIGYDTRVEKFPSGVYGQAYLFPTLMEPERMNWEPDQSPKHVWLSWKPWQQEVWLRHMGEIMPKLGYTNWEVADGKAV